MELDKQGELFRKEITIPLHISMTVSLSKKMKKINKIGIVILLLILCSACGRPPGSSAKMGRDVNCESELGNFSKYIKLDKLSTAMDKEVKVYNQKVGIYCGNKFTITSELTDFFTNYRMVNATDTLEDTIEYGAYTVNIKYYLYDDILVSDSNTEIPQEVEISGLTAQYNIKIDDKYISGLEPGFSLNKKYDDFNKLSKTYLEEINLLIIEELDTYTNLKTI